MSNWKEFEIEATKYLENKFGHKASFVHQGEEDSTIPDILVQSNKGSYYIEAKNCPAQCGQFVLLPNLNSFKFEYSAKNVNHYNNEAQIIINYMNENFEAFKEAGTAGRRIAFPNDQDIFANWIISTYRLKGIKFIITNDFKILKLNDFKQAFDIIATYRIKRSGSSDVGFKYINEVCKYIKSNYNINSLNIDNGKVYITSFDNLHNCRFLINGIEFMISNRENYYEIRKLSNTFNANVIFSIYLKNGFVGLSDGDIEGLI